MNLNNCRVSTARPFEYGLSNAVQELSAGSIAALWFQIAFSNIVFVITGAILVLAIVGTFI